MEACAEITARNGVCARGDWILGLAVGFGRTVGVGLLVETGLFVFAGRRVTEETELDTGFDVGVLGART